MVTLSELAKALGGEISKDSVLCPGPGHSAEDRSLSVKIDDAAPYGLLVHSFSDDDWKICLNYVREKLGLRKWEPKKKAKKSNGTTKAFSETVARYVYRNEDGTPYLQVCRTQAKT